MVSVATHDLPCARVLNARSTCFCGASASVVSAPAALPNLAPYLLCAPHPQPPPHHTYLKYIDILMVEKDKDISSVPGDGDRSSVPRTLYGQSVRDGQSVRGGQSVRDLSISSCTR